MTQPSTESARLPPEEWNDTAHPFEDQVSLVELVERQVRAAPDAVAVELGAGRRKSYAQLWTEAGKITRFLCDQGVGRGDYVGILVENSALSVVAVLGVLRSGAAYVPLDARSPAARVAKPVRSLGI